MITEELHIKQKVWTIIHDQVCDCYVHAIQRVETSNGTLTHYEIAGYRYDTQIVHPHNLYSTKEEAQIRCDIIRLNYLDREIPNVSSRLQALTIERDTILQRQKAREQAKA